MRKVLIAAVSFAALAGIAGVAVAQQGEAPRERSSGLFQADANSDGTVTRAELDANSASRFRTLDANSDGQLTREEMRAGRERGDGEHGGRGRHGRGGHRGMHMERADANNDGNITRDEFLAGPTQMFARMDANSDGVISANERPQRGERGERGQRGDRPERPRLDSDNNGQISQAEFAAMNVARFERIDANHDGRVTRDEVEAGRPQRPQR